MKSICMIMLAASAAAQYDHGVQHTEAHMHQPGTNEVRPQTSFPTMQPTFAVDKQNKDVDPDNLRDTHHGAHSYYNENEDQAHVGGQHMHGAEMDSQLDGNDHVSARTNNNGDGWSKHGNYVNGESGPAATAVPTMTPTAYPTDNWSSSQCTNGAYNVPIGWEGPCAGADYCKLCKCSSECESTVDGRCARWGQATLSIERKKGTAKAADDVCGAPAGTVPCTHTTCKYDDADKHPLGASTSQKVVQVNHRIESSCPNEEQCAQIAAETVHHCSTSWLNGVADCKCMCSDSATHKVWHSYSTWHRTTQNGNAETARHISYPVGTYGDQSVHTHVTTSSAGDKK